MAFQPKHYAGVIGRGEGSAMGWPEHLKICVVIQEHLLPPRENLDWNSSLIDMSQERLSAHIASRLDPEHGTDADSAGVKIIRSLRRRADVIEIGVAEENRLHASMPAASQKWREA